MAWTELTREPYKRKEKRYPSDLTDAEWTIVGLLLFDPNSLRGSRTPQHRALNGLDPARLPSHRSLRAFFGVSDSLNPYTNV